MRRHEKKKKSSAEEAREEGGHVEVTSGLARKRTSDTSTSSSLRPETEAIHRGERKDPTGALLTPIYQSSTFRLGPREYEALERDEYDGVYIYSRWGNPTTDAAAEKIACLEKGDRALVYASGMGAISSSVLAHLKKGDRLVASNDLYGGTIPFFRGLPDFGIEVENVDQTDVEAVAQSCQRGANVLYVETITNPLLKIAPMPELAGIAREAGAALLVDNTFPSPVNFRPLEHGAAVSIESCTKYLGGHSDIIAGSAAYQRDSHKRMWSMAIHLGATLDPHAAFLLNRGLKTVHLRVRRQNESALALAEFLEERKEVEKTIYPGLASHPQHSLAAKLLEGFGGMLTFIVRGGDQAARRVLDALQIVAQAPSLGSVESLVSMPVNTSHLHVSPEHRRKMGILPGTVRLSVGTEDVEDLKGDVANALRKA